ncbi:MAG: helix-turn-helix domain-containing protein [Candidatus Pacearchaeota archaeon]|jgi:ribosome-binding protein aMBF1 (putative translation factor)
MECSICGVSELTRPIFRALSPTGIVLVCENCAQEQGYPLVKKPGLKKEDFEKKDTVYETMVRLSGVKPKEERFQPIRESRAKEVISRNYEKKTKQEAVSLAPRPDLVDNFHWIIMRVRRVKGLTQGQLAERIGESESAIKMAEQGVIPQGYDLPNKLERFLGVKIVKTTSTPIQTNTQNAQPKLNLNNSNIVPETKKPEPQKIVYPKSGIISFDRKILDNLKIDDLKRIKMEKEKNKVEEKENNKEKKYVQDYD